MLGLLITPSNLIPIIFPALTIAFVLIFVARPIAVWLSLLPFHFPWREQVFIGWCGLRGAVPIILALFPSLAGLEHTQTYFELVFFVVLISLVLQGWTIAPIAKWMQIELPPSNKEPAHQHLTLKHDQDKELLVYTVVPESRAVGLAVKNLPVKEGSQFLGIIRNGILIDQNPSEALANEDQVVLLSSTNAKSALGQVFAKQLPSPSLDTSFFFGEFSLNPDAKLSDVAQAYGFEIGSSEHNVSVAEFIIRQFHGKPVIGDKVRLGAIKLIVKNIENERIVSVGLKLQPPE